MDLNINHIMTDWKIINPKAIRILEEDTMKIESIIQRLNMRIILSFIRSDGNCFYDSVFAAIQNSTTRILNANITIEMEQR